MLKPDVSSSNQKQLQELPGRLTQIHTVITQLQQSSSQQNVAKDQLFTIMNTILQFVIETFDSV